MSEPTRGWKLTLTFRPTRAQWRLLAPLLLGAGGPWKASAARRYPRGRRRCQVPT